jgi:hypothetical protein
VDLRRGARSARTARASSPGRSTEENIAAADVELTSDDLREIDEARIAGEGARYSQANQRMIDR